MNEFIRFVTETASPHPDAAWKAWQHQQRIIDDLHAQIMEMREQVEHLRQQNHELRVRIPRLRLVG